MAIQGLRDTSNFVTNQRPENWRETLMLLYPNSPEAAKAPLTALTSVMKSEKTDDPVFHWWEKELDDRRIQFSSDHLATDTTLNIDDTFKTAKIVKAGDILMIEQTAEYIRVSSDPVDSTHIQVARGVAGTTPAAIDFDGASKNPYAVVIGSAFEEGSLAPTGVNYDPNEKYNYTQIFRSTMEMTRTAERTRLRTGDHVKEARRECLEYISIDMERSFWFSKRHATTLNGRPLRYTAGIISQITTGAPANVVASGGAIDMDWLETYLPLIFKYGSSEKVAFGSNIALQVIGQVIRKNAQWNFESGIKEFGMAVTRITSPYGTLVFKSHPLFAQMTGGTNAVGGGTFLGVANNLYILDMDKLRYRYVDDLDYQGNLTQIGQDAKKSGYLAECGIELHHPKSHFIITGLTAGVVDTP